MFENKNQLSNHFKAAHANNEASNNSVNQEDFLEAVSKLLPKTLETILEPEPNLDWSQHAAGRLGASQTEFALKKDKNGTINVNIQGFFTQKRNTK